MSLSEPSRTSPRFFSPVQAHVAESAWSALGATNIFSQSAKSPGFGMAQQLLPERTSKDALSQQVANDFASTGSSQGAVLPRPMWTDTGVRVVEAQITEPKAVLRQRRLEPLTPYRRDAWAQELMHHALAEKYPHLVLCLSLARPRNPCRTTTRQEHKTSKDAHVILHVTVTGWKTRSGPW